MDKKTMRYEIAKEVFPQAIENSMMVVRNSNLTMMKYAAYLAVSYADALIKELERGQGESYTKRDVDNAYIEGMAFAKHELEKQGEQETEE